MSDLDERLREILGTYYPELSTYGDFEASGISDDDAIAQIKQAFADEDYVKNGVVTDWWADKYAKYRGYMTGQEWYERFKKELPNTKLAGILPGVETTYRYNTILLAARRAAGINNG